MNKGRKEGNLYLNTWLLFSFSAFFDSTLFYPTMSRDLFVMLRWPVLAIVLIAAIHFTGLYKYHVELVEKATINVTGEISV